METIKTNSPKGKVPFISKFAYGFGDVGCNFSWSFVVSFLMIFYTDVFGIGMAAVVVAVGKDVTVCKPGDNITARPQLVCGECGPCKRGQYNVCEHLRVEAFQADGVAQDYFVTTDDRVVVSLISLIVSGFTLCVSPDNALDTVLLDMPSSLAISIIVVCFI